MSINAPLAIQNFNTAQQIINKIISNPSLLEKPMTVIPVGDTTHYSLRDLLPTLQSLAAVAQASGVHLNVTTNTNVAGINQSLFIQA